MKKFKNLGKYNLHQSGYGRGILKNITVWEYEGKAYIKNARIYSTDFEQLQGELKGYVRVNKIETFYYQL